jgi:hypothetical protein
VFAFVLVLPLALPALAHHALAPETTPTTMDHGDHGKSHDVPSRDTPCPPLDTGLEACCVVDGLPTAPASSIAAPRVDRAASPVVTLPAALPSDVVHAGDDPHPWPVPTRIILSTFLN